MSIESQLKEAVDDLVQAVPHRPGLADIALRQAARRKHTARLAVAGGTAVALAVAVPLGIGELGSPGPRPTTTGQTQATQPQRPQLAVRTVTVDIDKLRQGALPAVPWSKNGHAYVGTTRLAGPNELHAAPMVRKVEGGYAILAYGEHERLYLLRNGETTTLSDRSQGRVGTVAVSPDGQQIAWTSTTGSGEAPNTLYLADVRSGEVTLQKPTSGVAIGGFLSSGRILLLLSAQGGGSIGTWNLQGNTIERWAGHQETFQIWDVAASGRLAILEPKGCLEVVETSTEKTLWKGCTLGDIGPLEFSPDGQYVLGLRGRDLVVADARTGKVGLTVRTKADVVHNVVWESDQSFVFTAWKDQHRTALVRCTILGACELASPVTTFEQGHGMVAHEGYWPYATLR